MQYFALLLSPSDAPEERTDPAALEAEMTAYNDFHARERSSIKAGDALTPAAAGVRITGGPEAPVITDGPFPESAEIAGGFYVFEADDLDAALALGRQVPHARKGAVEIWPMIMDFDSAVKLTSISDAGSAGLAASVTFRSQQNPADSPDNSSCDQWSITLFLVPHGTGYLIGPPPSSYHASFQAC